MYYTIYFVYISINIYEILFLFKKHKQFVKFRKIIEYNYNKYIAKFIKCGIIYEIRHTVK